MKYLLVWLHMAWKASSRSAGTAKLFISVTGPEVARSIGAAVRASGVMLVVIGLSFSVIALVCTDNTGVYLRRAGVKHLLPPSSRSPVATTDEETGRFRQRRRTRAA